MRGLAKQAGAGTSRIHISTRCQTAYLPACCCPVDPLPDPSTGSGSGTGGAALCDVGSLDGGLFSLAQGRWRAGCNHLPTRRAYGIWLLQGMTPSMRTKLATVRHACPTLQTQVSGIALLSFNAS